MKRTKVFKYLISSYMISATLAFASLALAGGFSLAPSRHLGGWFPLNLSPALGLLAIDLIAAYSLLYRSWHGRVLLSVAALFYLLNSVFATQLWASPLASSLSALHLILLGIILTMAWSDPIPQKIRRLQDLSSHKQQATKPEPQDANDD